jgi:uncharacterized protein (UPF0335 family)
MSDQPNTPKGSPLLKQLLESYERLESEKAGIDESLAGILGQLRSNGFDAKTFKALVKRRKQSRDAVREEGELLDLYERAVAEAGA